MRAEIVVLALIVGMCTYGFRFLPTRADLSGLKPGSILSRFLAATGPAAIATLFVASILPMARGDLWGQGPLLSGVLAVLGGFAATRSVVGATLAGAVAYGAVFAMLR